MLYYSSNTNSKNQHTETLPQEVIKENSQTTVEQQLRIHWLATDTSKTAIDLDEIRNWWPGKDWIPAINEPIYLSQEEALQRPYVTPESLWIAFALWDEAKFYPYSIMNWHEIVNDTINETPVTITFCPLCWSAIVYDRTTEFKVLDFGVSGLLRESNLLMYDKETETLRSQARWEAMVGHFQWTKLKRLKSDVINFQQFTQNYPDGVVLSDDTWYQRDYTFTPYGEYDENDILYFPVSNDDTRLPKKEILYIVNDNDTSLAFTKKGLLDQWTATLQVGEEVYTATLEKWITTVKNSAWKILPWYHEMWFSRIAHNPKSKNIRVE